MNDFLRKIALFKIHQSKRIFDREVGSASFRKIIFFSKPMMGKWDLIKAPFAQQVFAINNQIAMQTTVGEKNVQNH